MTILRKFPKPFWPVKTIVKANAKFLGNDSIRTTHQYSERTMIIAQIDFRGVTVNQQQTHWQPWKVILRRVR